MVHGLSLVESGLGLVDVRLEGYFVLGVWGLAPIG